MNPPTLHLGITLAGAVSAGAYSGGVMDYLLEALIRWEQEKASEAQLPAMQKTIPPHQVRIEVIGGASAGSITAALSMLALHDPAYRPLKYDEKLNTLQKTGNVFFDTWVNLSDTEQQTTMAAMLRKESPERVQNAPESTSLLNCEPIDQIAQNAIQAFRGKERASDLPPFVNPNVEVLMTLCSLRGVPVGVEFNSNNNNWVVRPSHQMALHKQYARFRLGETSDSKTHFGLHINASGLKGLENLFDCAIASSAFPFGLAARKLKFRWDYIKQQYRDFSSLDRSLDALIPESGMHKNADEARSVGADFEFVAVDGGMLNNEPFGEIEWMLKQQIKRSASDTPLHATILVDPFPNFGLSPDKYEPPANLRDFFALVFGALRDQGMLKEDDFKKTLQPGESPTRNMIFPSRHFKPERADDWVREKFPIACGALGGFSGFLDRRFRVHDYFLGRKNCRNFLYSYFGFLVEKGKHGEHPLFKDWTDAMVAKYRILWRSTDTHDFLPIIPLVDYVNELEAKFGHLSLNRHALETAIRNHSLQPDMPFPYLLPKDLLRLKSPLRKRVRFLIEHLGDEILKEGDMDPDTRFVLKTLTNRVRRVSGRLTEWLTRLIGYLGGYALVRRRVAKILVDYTMKNLLLGLHAHGLFKVQEPRVNSGPKP